MLHNTSEKWECFIPAMDQFCYLFSHCTPVKYGNIPNRFQDKNKSKVIWSGPQGSHLSSIHWPVSGWNCSSLWVQLQLWSIFCFCRLIMEAHSTLGCGGLTLANSPEHDTARSKVNNWNLFIYLNFMHLHRHKCMYISFLYRCVYFASWSFNERCVIQL